MIYKTISFSNQFFLKNKKGFVYTHLCKDTKCAEKIKEDTGATARCIPMNGGEDNKGKCICCNNDADRKVIFATSY